MKPKKKNLFEVVKLIRKHVPNMIAKDIVGVQPLPDDIFENFLKMNITKEKSNIKFGDLIHNFIYGYQVFNGKELIPIEDFMEKYGKEKINYWNKTIEQEQKK